MTGKHSTFSRENVCIYVHVHMCVLASSIPLHIVSLRHLFLPSNPHPALLLCPLVCGNSNLFLSWRCWD